MLLEFNMTRDYCKEWSPLEAIREIAQNAIDHGSYTTALEVTRLRIVSQGITLMPEHFALGHSSKSSSDIGGYGEGMKLAMLILTREGLNPYIRTGDKLITGRFILNPITNLETFNLEFTDAPHTDDTIFVCEHSKIPLAILKHRVTIFAEHPLPKVRDNVERLPTRPGDIYVNGLWVCNKANLTYGYDFAPGAIKLNRDRNMVEGVTWQLGQYYAHQDPQLVFNLLIKEAVDVSDVSYFLTPKLKAELTRLFYNHYNPDATIGTPGGYYSGNMVSFGHNTHRTFMQAGVKQAVPGIKPDSPTGILMDFHKLYKSKMRRDLRAAFDNLITQSKGWK